MVVIGSVREGRMADNITDWAVNLLNQDSELEIDIADLKEVDLPFYNEPQSPSDPNFSYKNANGAAWAKRVASADAFLFITPEYNHGPTAVMKNAIDWVYEGWKYKPVGFVSYGGAAAGTRAVQQLKLSALNVMLFPITNNVHIPIWGGGLDEEKRPLAHFGEGLKRAISSLKDLQKRLAP